MTNFSAFSDKDPNAVEPFTWNWDDVLSEPSTAETISTSDFTVPSGITEDSDSKTTTTATVVLSGCSAGSYDILNRITTSGGRTLDKTYTVPVSEQ